MIIGPTGSGLSYNSTPPMPAASPWPRLLIGPRYTSTFCLAAGFPLEGLEGGGTGRSGLRPIDLGDHSCRLLSAKNALLGRVRASSTLAWSVHQPRRFVVRGFTASGPRARAWMIYPPAGRGGRTAVPGSCAELRLQDTALLISGAGTGEHIVRLPSSSTRIHNEP